MLIKSYSQIVSGFQKTIQECEKLIADNIKKDMKLDEELKAIDQKKSDALQAKADLVMENRKAGALASKIMDLIEE